VALHFSTDGVQLFRNSKTESWPFLLINLNLDPREHRFDAGRRSELNARFKAEHFLSLGLTPGPKQPQDLDSFLQPLYKELKHLEEGRVKAYDVLNNEEFTLKAYVFLITGDTPGVSKLMKLSGHNAKRPCRACKIQGTPHITRVTIKRGNRSGTERNMTQYYYPFSVEVDDDWEDFCSTVRTMVLRDGQGYKEDGQRSQRNPELAKETGVKGTGLLSELQSIIFPESIPFDVMHLIHLSFVRDLMNLISGNYFGESSRHLNQKTALMSAKEWEALGVDMAKIRAPMTLGRKPENIQKYIKSFKAAELDVFLIYYLLPLIRGRVKEDEYIALTRLVFAVHLATDYEVLRTDVSEIQTHLGKFIHWFYKKFYRGDSELLPVCKYTIHGLIHLARNVENWGSASLFWQYPQVPTTSIWLICNRKDCAGS